MGAAWRDTIGRKTNFSQILEYIKEIRYLTIMLFKLNFEFPCLYYII